MILIADSGSTKTTWLDVDSGNKMITEGLNPHFTTDETFHRVFSTVRDAFPLTASSIEVYFYGAGCGDERQRSRVEQMLSSVFRPDSMAVETDMLGACRAASAGRESIVAILGTGSNACYFDGTAILCQPTSTGFVMGDNGSANHVGRILLNDYLTQRMPEAVRVMFHDDYPMSDTQFIDAVYHQPNANRFLASLAPFAVKYHEDDYCSQVLKLALYDWFHGPIDTLVQRTEYERGAINFVGGFAKAIEPMLRQFLADSPFDVGTVVADPIDELCNFHTRHNIV